MAAGEAALKATRWCAGSALRHITAVQRGSAGYSVHCPGQVDRSREADAHRYRFSGEPALISASSSAYVHLSLRRHGCGSERAGPVARIGSGLNGTDVRASCFLLTE